MYVRCSESSASEPDSKSATPSTTTSPTLMTATTTTSTTNNNNTPNKRRNTLQNVESNTSSSKNRKGSGDDDDADAGGDREEQQPRRRCFTGLPGTDGRGGRGGGSGGGGRGRKNTRKSIFNGIGSNKTQEICVQSENAGGGVERGGESGEPVRGYYKEKEDRRERGGGRTVRVNVDGDKEESDVQLGEEEEDHSNCPLDETINYENNTDDVNLRNGSLEEKRSAKSAIKTDTKREKTGAEQKSVKNDKESEKIDTKGTKKEDKFTDGGIYTGENHC